MKRILLTTITGAIFLLLAQTLLADIVTKSGTISADEIWSDTVHVTGDIIILDDVTLNISAGTLVEFQAHYMLKILGTILAKGTDTDSIIFTIKDPTGFDNPNDTIGGWKGIFFNNAQAHGGADGAMIDNDTSVLSKCRIEFIKVPRRFWGEPSSVIHVEEFSKLEISGCEIRSNYTFWKAGAIYMNNNADIIIRDNYIHHNTAYEDAGAIYVLRSSPIIEGNTISHNKTLIFHGYMGRGGGIHSIGNNGLIRNNIIQYNSAVTGSGINNQDSGGKVEGNTISHNTGYGDATYKSLGGGIACTAIAEPLIINNKIANNTADYGGGIYSYQSYPLIINNLIVNNTAEYDGGAMQALSSKGMFVNNTVANNTAATANGIQFQDSDPLFMNNILWGDTELIHLQDVFAKISIQNCIVKDTTNSIWGAGSYTSENLSEADPGFVQESAGMGKDFEGLDAPVDWSVTSTSPCVNAGAQNMEAVPFPQKDLAGNDRIEHAIIDIGAYEVFIETISFQDTIKSDTTWVADTIHITGDVVVNDDVILTVLPGTFVEFDGHYMLKVNGTIKAIGKPDAPIIFSAKKDTTGFWNIDSDAGSWEGIQFNNGHDGMNDAMSDNDTSVFKYCEFRFAKNPGPDLNGAALTIRYYDNVQISECYFHDNASKYGSGGIYAQKSTLTITDCEFSYNNSDEGGAFTSHSCEIILADNLFTNNYASNMGGAIRFLVTEATVRGNTFSFNASYDGGVVTAHSSPVIFIKNIFANNVADNGGGALNMNYTDFQLLNNILVNNYAGDRGGAISMATKHVTVTINNIICNNYSGRLGGAIYNYYSDHHSINDIIYGNDAPPQWDGRIRGKQYFAYSSVTDVSFNNCNLEGLGDSIWIFNGSGFTGTLANTIDSLPNFLRPSDGSGNGYDGLTADWRPISISPCINSGTNDALSYLDDTDLRGNSRLFGDIIDMGPYESQYGTPQITLQPRNQIVCTGDTVTFLVETRFQATFQWQKDGQDIPGATGNELRIDSVYSAYDGNYLCIVSNSHGSVNSNSAYLLARAQPEFLSEPENTWGVEGERTILSSSGTGTPPLRFQWYKDGVLIPGANYPELWINNTGAQHEGLFHCELTNACNTVSTDTVQLYLAPQICMVTSDTNSAHNLVVWEKNSTAPIESYNIFRESIVAGEYEVIGNVPADSLSIFVDTVVNPVAQAYIYKINARDIDGNESDIDLCKPHRTIHLLSSENTELNTIQLDWSYYYGFYYGTFHIYRGLSGAALDSVYSLSASSTQWIDTEASPEVDYYYRVLVVKETPCTPTSNKKAGAGPYHHALSNLDNNKLQSTGMDKLTESTLKIYPNPFSDFATLEFTNPEQAEFRMVVRNLSGKAVLLKEGITENRVIIERGNLEPGFYSIELTGDKIMRGRLVIR